ARDGAGPRKGLGRSSPLARRRASGHATNRRAGPVAVGTSHGRSEIASVGPSYGTTRAAVVIVPRSASGGSAVIGRFRPIDHVPPGVEVVGPLVLVLQVVGVLPDVHTDDRGLAVGDRGILVRG